MLTALVRRSLPTAPLHGYNAPVAGSGKSLLVDLASLLASGNLAPVIAQGRTEEETEKRLDAALIAGDAVISLDNCTLPLRGDKLCMALSTAGSLSLRILGLSKNALVVNNAALFATGNNLEIEGDMTRRVILCSVNPKVERPELRAFKMDPVATLREKRPAYVMMALMILRAYIVAGRPDVGTTPLAGFVDWSRLVRDALVWLGEKDACATMDDIIKVDPKREQLVNLLHAWHVALGDREVTAAEIIDAATAGAMAQEPETEATREARGRLYAALRAIAAPLPGARSAAQIDAVRLGLYLRKNKDAIREGLFIGVGGSTRGKVQSWYAGETKRVSIR